ncbi:MAG: cation transporter [Firmicutes bacterium]|nr:cation transporter [Bacillota bacterium]
MTELIIKKFVKDYENIADAKVRETYGKISGMVGIATNTILSVIKIVIGIIFSSIAIIADGINNLTDAGSSVVTLIGFKLAGMPEDKDHPYGHARYEYITGLIVSFIIIVLGIQMMKESFVKIIHPDPVNFSWITIIFLALAVVIKLWQMLFYKTVAKKINSATVMALSKDSRNDVVSTAVVLLGLLIGGLTNIQLDGILGAFVAAFIIISGIQLVKETISPLLGEAPDPELVKELETMVAGYEGVIGIHDLVVHDYGPGKIFASLHAEVDSRVNVMVSHDLIDCIEREVNDKLGIHFVIHMDPVVLDDPMVDRYRNLLSAVMQDIDPVLRFHDFRCVAGPTHTNLIFDIVVPINYNKEDDDIISEVQQALKDIDERIYAVITIDKDYTNGQHRQ